jgi:sugar/nucleoside kinase (ribokinase family)
MNNENYEFDFVSLGDITIDAFIKLEEFSVHTDRGIKEICMSFGDKIPYKEVIEVSAVGNSPNAAVSAARLGLRSACITNLGNDRNGQKCIDTLENDKVSTKFIQKHDGIKTNYHYVLQYEEERTILIKHEEYPYKLPKLPPIKWLYLSSLGENSLPHHKEITAWLKEHPETKFAFQPGTFQIKQGYENLKELYEHTHLFFCNKQEAQKILETKENDIKKLLTGMHDLGVKIPVISDGADGAYFYDGREGWFMPIYPDPAPPVDRTGAGDSFSSTFTSFLAMGLPTSEALKRAPINSMSVVQYTGAQEGLLSKKKLEQFLENAPSDYKAIKII